MKNAELNEKCTGPIAPDARLHSRIAGVKAATPSALSSAEKADAEKRARGYGLAEPQRTAALAR